MLDMIWSVIGALFVIGSFGFFPSCACHWEKGIKIFGGILLIGCFAFSITLLTIIFIVYF